MNISMLRHVVTLENPGTPQPDGDSGIVETWAPLTPARVPVAIAPATARELERLTAGTVESIASHIVRMRFHPQVTTQTRMTKGARNEDGSLLVGSREFSVVGVANIDERNREMVCLCAERVL